MKQKSELFYVAGEVYVFCVAIQQISVVDTHLQKTGKVVVMVHCPPLLKQWNSTDKGK